MYYLISYTLFDVPEHTVPLRQLSIADFDIVAKDSLFWFSIVTVDLWRHANVGHWHISWLVLHARIGAKAIFASE